ncbi:testis-expressed protein 29-like [Vombatus ursinus]|uniref:testis-expressed protein 29-like n=1 Tax=Vombatus ursinus TaxID=29139 RepID=UPI000FFD1498|nr:testis-expressed protein 29-like [Vombatus ursinus]XP_027722215.1 testis-expressed protein 29-like [Vombatus ursinus]
MEFYGFPCSTACSQDSFQMLGYESVTEKKLGQAPPRLKVCDIPLLDICDYNVSRDQCKKLGGCFLKEVCYVKATPAYVQGLTALIIIILGIFIVYVIYRVVQGRNKKSTQKLYGLHQKKKKLKPESTTNNHEISDEEEKKILTEDSKKPKRELSEDEVILTVPAREEELE